jgi:hypothetical protein
MASNLSKLWYKETFVTEPEVFYKPCSEKYGQDKTLGRGNRKP